MIPQDLIKKITEAAHKKKQGATSDDNSKSARQAAAKKLISAIKADDSDTFLTALSELRTMDDE